MVVVEDAARREHEIENAAVTTFNGAAGETPMTVLPKLARAYPNIYVVRDLPDADTVEFPLRANEEERLSIGGCGRRNAAEALLRVLVMKVPAAEFAPAVVGGRQPADDPQAVREMQGSLRPDAGIAQAIRPARRHGCRRSIVRRSRSQKTRSRRRRAKNASASVTWAAPAFFELLVVNDAVREALIKTPKLDVVRAAARKAGMRTLQEEGIVMVVKGVTSLPELMRVLKQ